jgi:hypothetical protein
MTFDEFWSILEKVHRKSGADVEKKFGLLEEELAKLSLAEVQSFDALFTDCLDRAYTWELWGAAYVIGGGCSDDGFWDFRSTLISCGRGIFERALEDPESLAELDSEVGEALQVEGLQYIAGKVARSLGGDVLDRSRPHPSQPSGQKWDEEAVAELYPKLARKYGEIY